MPMWDPIVFAERDGKGRAFVFYAVSDSQRRGECRQEKSVPLLGFGSKPIKPWVRGGDIYVVASTDATLKEWMTPRRVLKSADFNGAPITLNGPAVEMDEANSETGNRDWVVPVCVNGMKQVNVGTVLAQYGRGVHREGGTGEGGFNPKCGAEAVRKCGVIVSSDLGKTWDTSRLHESLGFDRKNGILLADMTVAEIGEGGLYACVSTESGGWRRGRRARRSKNGKKHAIVHCHFHGCRKNVDDTTRDVLRDANVRRRSETFSITTQRPVGVGVQRPIKLRYSRRRRRCE